MKGKKGENPSEGNPAKPSERNPVNSIKTTDENGSAQ